MKQENKKHKKTHKQQTNNLEKQSKTKNLKIIKTHKLQYKATITKQKIIKSTTRKIITNTKTTKTQQKKL